VSSPLRYDFDVGSEECSNRYGARALDAGNENVLGDVAIGELGRRKLRKTSSAGSSDFVSPEERRPVLSDRISPKAVKVTSTTDFSSS
jgi:hypothetical protein